MGELANAMLIFIKWNKNQRFLVLINDHHNWFFNISEVGLGIGLFIIRPDHEVLVVYQKYKDKRN